MSTPSPIDRLHELLADRTGGCLPHEERAELEALLAAHPEVDAAEFDAAAAALHLALTPRVEPVPSDVRARLDAAADAWLAGRAPRARATRTATASSSASTSPPRGRLLASPWAGWIAAAALVLGFLGWRLGGAAPLESDPRAERLALLEQPDARTWAWQTTADPLAGGVGGDVVWSASEQEGFLRFTGLPANDPQAAQYQLWIFDGERAPEDPSAQPIPVDGGVFDVPGGAGGEDVVVPIRAKLAVGKPTLFAVTLERPGGVVVSRQEHLLLIAPVE